MKITERNLRKMIRNEIKSSMNEYKEYPRNYGPKGPVVATLFNDPEYKVYRTGFREDLAEMNNKPPFVIESPEGRYHLYPVADGKDYDEDGKLYSVSRFTGNYDSPINGYRTFEKHGMRFIATR